MGRIADALKKAEQERLDSVVDGAGGAVTTSVLAPPAAYGGQQPLEQDGAGWDPVDVVEGMSESIVAYYDRSSSVSEQYRALRTRILSHNTNHEHRVLAVTSSTPREGKTITTVNLGFTFAEIRHVRALVVDADFRRSSLAGALNLDRSPGLAELLTGEATYDEVIQNTPVPNLRAVTAGQLKGRSATELLSAMSTRSVFRWFESQYHYTFVDTPPAGTVSDVGIIGQLCSGVIMVVRMHRTPEPLAKRAVRLLQGNNVPILGCAVIGRDGPNGGYGYRYGDYDYYSYSTQSPNE